LIDVVFPLLSSGVRSPLFSFTMDIARHITVHTANQHLPPILLDYQQPLVIQAKHISTDSIV